jgi:ferritin
MIDATVFDMLQLQMNRERQNAAFYRAHAQPLEASGWIGSAKWFRKSADEEETHAAKFAQHMIDRTPPSSRQFPAFEGLTSVPVTAITLVQFFAAAYEAEVANTQALSTIYGYVMQVRDYQSMAFLHWFMKEQTKSEAEISTYISQLQIMGNYPSSLNLFDERLR